MNFKEFLKQNNCLESFEKNLRKGKGIPLDKYLAETDSCDYIAAGFYWKLSPEGKDYWCNIQIKWDESNIRI